MEVSSRVLVAAKAKSVAELDSVLESDLMSVATETIQKWVIVKMLLKIVYSWMDNCVFKFSG